MICTSVVTEPVKCATCESLYCTPCLDKWLALGNKQCPMKCSTQWAHVKLDRFARQTLARLKFQCGDCLRVFTYQTQTCVCLELECPTKCGEKA